MRSVLVSDLADRILERIEIRSSSTRIEIRERTYERVIAFAFASAATIAFCAIFYLVLPTMDAFGKAFLLVLASLGVIASAVVFASWNGRIVLDLQEETCRVEWRFFFLAFSRTVVPLRHSIVTSGVAEAKEHIEETGVMSTLAQLVFGVRITHSFKRLVPALVARSRDDDRTQVLARFEDPELLERALQELRSIGGAYVTHDPSALAAERRRIVEHGLAPIGESIPEPEPWTFHSGKIDHGDPRELRRKLKIFYIGLGLFVLLLGAASVAAGLAQRG